MFNPLCHDLIENVVISLLVESFNDFKEQRQTIREWVSEFESNRILDHVQKIQSVMAIQIFNMSFNTESIHNSVEALDIYNSSNEMKPEKHRLSYIEFYNDGVNKEIELSSQYEKWVRALEYCRREGIVYKKSINFTL
jgi:RAB protein geranylgeranyltransferase component A